MMTVGESVAVEGGFAEGVERASEHFRAYGTQTGTRHATCINHAMFTDAPTCFSSAPFLSWRPFICMVGEWIPKGTPPHCLSFSLFSSHDEAVPPVNNKEWDVSR